MNKTRWKDSKPPLMIILGDHGMADAGGHGGSSTPETLTPMIFVKPKELHLVSASGKKPASGGNEDFLIKQYDLVPTLAWLTGVPIPKNSLGSLIFDDGGKSAEKYVKQQVLTCIGEQDDSADFQEKLRHYEDNLTDFNLNYMVLGICGAVLSCILSFETGIWRDISLVEILRLMQILGLLSSSIIEEEHQPIFFICMTILAWYGRNCEGNFVKIALGLGILRIARTINQVSSEAVTVDNTSMNPKYSIRM